MFSSNHRDSDFSLLSDLNSFTQQLLDLQTSEGQENELIHDRNPFLLKICYYVEKILSNNLKDVNFIGGTFMWDFIQNLPKCLPGTSKIIELSKDCSKTSIGRGRIFIRLALNDGELGDYLSALYSNKELLRSFYKDNALFRNSEFSNLFLSLLGSLSHIQFSLVVKDKDLDKPNYWEEVALVLLSINTPPTTVTTTKFIHVQTPAPTQSSDSPSPSSVTAPSTPHKLKSNTSQYVSATTAPNHQNNNHDSTTTTTTLPTNNQDNIVTNHYLVFNSIYEQPSSSTATTNNNEKPMLKSMSNIDIQSLKDDIKSLIEDDIDDNKINNSSNQNNYINGINNIDIKNSNNSVENNNIVNNNNNNNNLEIEDTEIENNKLNTSENFNLDELENALDEITQEEELLKERTVLWDSLIEQLTRTKRNSLLDFGAKGSSLNRDDKCITPLCNAIDQIVSNEILPSIGHHWECLTLLCEGSSDIENIRILYPNNDQRMRSWYYKSLTEATLSECFRTNFANIEKLKQLYKPHAMILQRKYRDQAQTILSDLFAKVQFFIRWDQEPAIPAPVSNFKKVVTKIIKKKQVIRKIKSTENSSNNNNNSNNINNLNSSSSSNKLINSSEDESTNDSYGTPTNSNSNINTTILVQQDIDQQDSYSNNYSNGVQENRINKYYNSNPSIHSSDENININYKDTSPKLEQPIVQQQPQQSPPMTISESQESVQQQQQQQPQQNDNTMDDMLTSATSSTSSLKDFSPSHSFSPEFEHLLSTLNSEQSNLHFNPDSYSVYSNISNTINTDGSSTTTQPSNFNPLAGRLNGDDTLMSFDSSFQGIQFIHDYTQEEFQSRKKKNMYEGEDNMVFINTLFRKGEAQSDFQSQFCPSCHASLEKMGFFKTRYCYYTGKYYCTSCHHNQKSMIPARILCRWDFKLYPVSDASKYHITKNMDVPFDIFNFNPTVYTLSSTLQRILAMRSRLHYIGEYIETCRSKVSIDNLATMVKEYIIKDNVHLFSMVDLDKAHSGILEPQISQVMDKYVHHVTQSCSTCKGKGFICEFCDDSDGLIFSWMKLDINFISQCDKCHSLSHRKCFTKERCPKCIRFNLYFGICENSNFQSKSLEYDYIVLGSGTAGSVVAGKLSDDPSYSVLMVEEGPGDTSPNIYNISNWAYNWVVNPDPKYSKTYFSVPQVYMKNRVWGDQRGVMLGGCNSHNGMVTITSSKTDFDGFADQISDPGWRYENMKKYFTDIKNNFDLTFQDDNRVLLPELRQALNENGFTFNPNMFDTGVLPNSFNNFVFMFKQTDNGNQPPLQRRQTTYTQYVSKFKDQNQKQNLDVKIYQKAIKLDYQRCQTSGNVKVVGVTLKNVQSGELTYVKVRKEVIVSLGAYDSPKFLQLNGIGDRNLLNQFGIETVVHSPGVGQNLRQHLYTSYTGKPLSDQLSSVQIPVRNPISDGFQIFGSLNGSQTDYKVTCDFGQDKKLECFVETTHIHSTGYVKIVSNNHQDPPEVNENAMKEQYDRDAYTESIRTIRRIQATLVKNGVLKNDIDPSIPDSKTSFDDIFNYIQDHGAGEHHPCCTIKMGANGDDSAPLTTDLKVKGVTNLRVVDASIFPSHFTGNINTPIAASAVKAVDLILNKK
eukprot:gene11211-13736_t